MPLFPIATRCLAALFVCVAADAAFGQAKPPAPPGKPVSDISTADFGKVLSSVPVPESFNLR